MLRKGDFVLLGNDISSPVFVLTGDPLTGVNLNGSGETLHFVRREVRPWWRPKVELSLPAGIIPFGQVREVKPEELYELKPGDHVTFLDFHFKFYDFALPGHLPYKDYLVNLNHREVCNWEITKEFYTEAIARGRFMITITFLPENWEKESFAGFLIAEPTPDDDIYFWLICARSFVDESGAEISPSFGVLLQSIMLNFLRRMGYRRVFLDALPSCVKYYQKYGYTVEGRAGEKMRMKLEGSFLGYDYSLSKLKELERYAITHKGYLTVA